MNIAIGATNIATTADQDAGLQAAVDSVNAARPLDGQGNPIGVEQTPESYLALRIGDVLNSYAAQAVAAQAEAIKSAFIAATPDQRNAITTAASTVTTPPIKIK